MGVKKPVVNSVLKYSTALALWSLTLGGCTLMQGELFNETFWAGSPFRVNDEAELGIADLAKGNYVTAEAHFKRALRTNPRDIDALIGAGILYQNTGQMTKSRQMYEAVLALHPDDSHQFVVWNNIETRPAAQIASVNLSLLETGGTPSAAASTLITPPGQPVGASGNSPTSMPGQSLAKLGKIKKYQKQKRVAQEPNDIVSFVGEQANMISRFSTLRVLKDQGLITKAEFIKRRQTNVGALLPLTSPPPAAGLERPVPSSEQIAGRFRAIARALEMRAITVAQHTAERSMILDALMPSAPVVIANPGVPPRGLMQAADAVRRLEKLKSGGYISSLEYDRERKAIELSMRPPTPLPSQSSMVSKPAKNQSPLVKSESRKSSGTQPAVHLASYRTAKQAARGWAQIRRAHKALLRGLTYTVSRVNLGKKGIYYRLKVGPLPSSVAAKGMCRKLKRRRQFCEPSTMTNS